MKAFFSLFLLITLGAMGATAAGLVKYELQLGEFHELKIVDGINVVYTCNPDSAGYAVFTCPSSQASAFIFNNKKGKLTMQVSSEIVGTSNLPTIHVYSTYLTRVENSGDSLLKVASIAEGPKFSAKLIGNGRIIVRNIKATEVNATLAAGNGSVILSGTCSHASFSVVGANLIQADELEAQTVSVKAWGTKPIGVWAVKSLSVSGPGSSTIYFKGSPEIKNRSVGVKISPIAN